MADFNKHELCNTDPDEVAEVLEKVETSFAFKFTEMELEESKTFGELCDIITDKVPGIHSDSCTTQQAFYKIRNILAETLAIDKLTIEPDTNLQLLIPRRNRRKKIAELDRLLGFKTKILRPKSWITDTFMLMQLASIVSLFIVWKLALAVLILSITAHNITTRFGIEMDLQTVSQLVKKIARENYRSSRRDNSTINKKEIAQTVKELFMHELGLEESVLTRQATFD